jgi:hypothetical protein
LRKESKRILVHFNLPKTNTHNLFLRELIANKRVRIVSHIIIDEDNVLLTYKHEDGVEIAPTKYNNIPIAVYVTSWARLRLLDAMIEVNLPPARPPSRPPFTPPPLIFTFNRGGGGGGGGGGEELKKINVFLFAGRRPITIYGHGHQF